MTCRGPGSASPPETRDSVRPAMRAVDLMGLLRAVVGALLFFSLAGSVQGAPPPPAEVRAAFRRQLDRPKVALDPQRTRPDEKGPDGTVTERLTIATEKKRSGAIERVPMVIVRPRGPAGKRPAVIVLHG